VSDYPALARNRPPPYSSSTREGTLLQSASHGDFSPAAAAEKILDCLRDDRFGFSRWSRPRRIPSYPPPQIRAGTKAVSSTVCGGQFSRGRSRGDMTARPPRTGPQRADNRASGDHGHDIDHEKARLRASAGARCRHGEHPQVNSQQRPPEGLALSRAWLPLPFTSFCECGTAPSTPKRCRSPFAPDESRSYSRSPGSEPKGPGVGRHARRRSLLTYPAS
jgi:hypothetical protein